MIATTAVAIIFANNNFISPYFTMSDTSKTKTTTTTATNAADLQDCAIQPDGLIKPPICRTIGAGYGDQIEEIGPDPCGILGSESQITLYSSTGKTSRIVLIRKTPKDFNYADNSPESFELARQNIKNLLEKHGVYTEKLLDVGTPVDEDVWKTLNTMYKKMWSNISAAAQCNSKVYPFWAKLSVVFNDILHPREETITVSNGDKYRFHRGKDGKPTFSLTVK